MNILTYFGTYYWESFTWNLDI